MKTVEQIFEEYIGPGQMGVDFEKKDILEAMQIYAEQECKNRDEIIKAQDELISIHSRIHPDARNPYFVEERLKLRSKIEQLKTEIK